MQKVWRCVIGSCSYIASYNQTMTILRLGLYVQGHIDRRSICRILVDGGAAINLMLYSVFKKLEREDDELMKTNLTLNDVGGLDGG
jgi:hypothetical protein